MWKGMSELRSLAPKLSSGSGVHVFKFSYPPCPTGNSWQEYPERMLLPPFGLQRSWICNSVHFFLDSRTIYSLPLFSKDILLNQTLLKYSFRTPWISKKSCIDQIWLSFSQSASAPHCCKFGLQSVASMIIITLIIIMPNIYSCKYCAGTVLNDLHA